jgi:hypothetical protein
MGRLVAISNTNLSERYSPASGCTHGLARLFNEPWVLSRLSLIRNSLNTTINSWYAEDLLRVKLLDGLNIISDKFWDIAVRFVYFHAPDP